MVSISNTTVAIILTVVAVLFYIAFARYGTWSSKTDSRQSERNQHLQSEDKFGPKHAHKEFDDR